MVLDDYLDQGLHVDRYHSLENDLLKFLDFISLDSYKTGSERESIKSIYLADLLLRIGSNIDIFFRKYIKSNSDSVCVQIKAEKPKETDWNWADYKKLEAVLGLSGECVVITPTGEKLYPFAESGKSWDQIVQSDKYWWNSYNSVKHNADFEKANLDNVLQSLGALLILICRVINVKKLIYYGFISVDKGYARSVIEGKSDGKNITFMATKLFIYPSYIEY